ncbi:unnamed protein product [Pleuronectes platessa]|uniref:Uncharacterized protein n=1 Tax=Pleuronectes platessa TaxID=8262 RepID=A0A9N7VBY1_PLEPL|nr:unnamed protein product [Pleuronectes platessa]
MSTPAARCRLRGFIGSSGPTSESGRGVEGGKGSPGGPGGAEAVCSQTAAVAVSVCEDGVCPRAPPSLRDATTIKERSFPVYLYSSSINPMRNNLLSIVCCDLLCSSSPCPAQLWTQLLCTADSSPLSGLISRKKIVFVGGLPTHVSGGGEACVAGRLRRGHR